VTIILSDLYGDDLYDNNLDDDNLYDDNLDDDNLLFRCAAVTLAVFVKQYRITSADYIGRGHRIMCNS
jgi:hypothetical protein